MTELGIPGAKTCGHTAPTFGCIGCINADREAADKKTYEAWCKNFTRFRCGHCGKPQKPFSYHRQDGKLVGVMSCNSLTKDGEFLCEDDDRVVALA